jgi:hypothetical protein
MMALFEDFTLSSVTSTALIGLGLVVAAPVLVPLVGAVVRPVVRLAILTGVTVYDAAAAAVTMAGEDVRQIVAEAVAEARPAALPPHDDIAPHILRPEGASA